MLLFVWTAGGRPVSVVYNYYVTMNNGIHLLLSILFIRRCSQKSSSQSQQYAFSNKHIFSRPKLENNTGTGDVPILPIHNTLFECYQNIPDILNIMCVHFWNN